MPRIEADINELKSIVRKFQGASERINNIVSNIQNQRNSIAWEGKAQLYFSQRCAAWEADLRNHAGKLVSIASELSYIADQLSRADGLTTSEESNQ